jgi:hypothetical protein
MNNLQRPINDFLSLALLAPFHDFIDKPLQQSAAVDWVRCYFPSRDKTSSRHFRSPQDEELRRSRFVP